MREMEEKLLPFPETEAIIYRFSVSERSGVKGEGLKGPPFPLHSGTGRPRARNRGGEEREDEHTDVLLGSEGL